jgi:hypothetical protein
MAFSSESNDSSSSSIDDTEPSFDGQESASSEPVSPKPGSSDSPALNDSVSSDFSDRSPISIKPPLFPIPTLQRPPDAEHPPRVRQFVIADVHATLEMAERRIVAGKLPGFTHPAEVAKVPHDVLRELQWTAEERMRPDQYAIARRVRRIPAFWPDRHYDKNAEKMPVYESDRLKQTVAEAERKRGVKRQAGEANFAKYQCSVVEVETEDFDERTDFEFY